MVSLWSHGDEGYRADETEYFYYFSKFQTQIFARIIKPIVFFSPILLKRKKKLLKRRFEPYPGKIKIVLRVFRHVFFLFLNKK